MPWSIPCPLVEVSGKSSTGPGTRPAAVRRSTTLQRAIVWAARVVWLALAVAGGQGFGDALAAHSRPVQLTGTICLWAIWAAVALASLVPSTASLTLMRMVVPGALVAAVVAAVEAGTVASILTTVFAAAMAVLTASGELGQVFAQGSAYGDEQRFLLRPPAALLVPVVVTWSAWCAAWLIGPLALAAGAWVLGGALTVVALLLTAYLSPRFHRLTRRWLVVVPAGLVLHDHVVLAETVMFVESTLAGVGLAYADTEAADLTGPAAGHAVEIRLHEHSTVVTAPTRAKPGGTALHVRSVLVAPSRPGSLLAHLDRRRSHVR